MASEIVVIKFGGNALTQDTARAFCQTVAQLPSMGFLPVIVHGGGPQINEMLDNAGIESHFVNGMRYTDEQTLRIAEMVLSGEVSKMLVQFLGNCGVNAVGISGKDARTFLANKLTHDDNGDAIDLGCVGKIATVNTQLIDALIDQHMVPVVAPIALGNDGKAYNINADYVAAELAKALGASRFILMTNISGLLDGEGSLIASVTAADIEGYIADGVIAGGMIPKTRCVTDVLGSVSHAYIIDGRDTNNLLSVLAGDAVGTRLHA